MATQSVHTDLAHAIGLGTPRRSMAAARIFSQFDRAQLEGFIAVAVDVLDAIDGEPDVEPNGDELDGSNAEDEFIEFSSDGPGCPVADPKEYSIPEAIRQREFKRSPRNEDDEEDNEDRGEFEDEPMFGRRQCHGLSVMYGDGPGGGSLLDSDVGYDGA